MWWTLLRSSLSIASTSKVTCLDFVLALSYCFCCLSLSFVAPLLSRRSVIRTWLTSILAAHVLFTWLSVVCLLIVVLIAFAELPCLLSDPYIAWGAYHNCPNYTMSCNGTSSFFFFFTILVFFFCFLARKQQHRINIIALLIMSKILKCCRIRKIINANIIVVTTMPQKMIVSQIDVAFLKTSVNPPGTGLEPSASP